MEFPGGAGDEVWMGEVDDGQGVVEWWACERRGGTTSCQREVVGKSMVE